MDLACKSPHAVLARNCAPSSYGQFTNLYTIRASKGIVPYSGEAAPRDNLSGQAAQVHGGPRGPGPRRWESHVKCTPRNTIS